MKKLMCAVAAVAAGVAFADDAAVQSANIVGYMSNANRTESLTEAQVYTLCSIPFIGVDGGNVPVSALKFEGVAMGDGPYECDFIQIWNGEGGFNSFYCYSEDGIWYKTTDGEPEMSEVYKDGIPGGTPFWYVAWRDGVRDGAAKSTISGAVDNEAFKGYNLRYESETEAQVYTLLTNPFPVSWMIGEGVCEITGIAKGDGPYECDFIQIWNGEGGFNSFYCYSEDGIWYKTTDGEPEMTEVYKNGIPAGTPFWYVAWRDGDRGGETPTITFYNTVNK